MKNVHVSSLYTEKNNKGFLLLEVLASIVVLMSLSVVVVHYYGICVNTGRALAEDISMVRELTTYIEHARSGTYADSQSIQRVTKPVQSTPHFSPGAPGQLPVMQLMYIAKKQEEGINHTKKQYVLVAGVT